MDRLTAHERYWQKRVHSKPFKRALAAALAQELRALAATRVKDVLDAEPVRSAIREWDSRMVNRELVAELIIRSHRRLGERAARQGQSLRRWLDPQLVADIDAILKEEMTVPHHVEDLIANLMQQEFVRKLFTDIIFTAIVSFYEKVNPFFGAIAMRALEEQIKSFIRLFMPMLQQQATAFAVSRENQRSLLDFARAIMRQLLDEPVGNFAATASAGQRQKAEALIRKAAGNAKLEATMHSAALALWDEVYKAVRDKRVGELVRLDEHATQFAERSVAAIVAALTRPHLLRLVAAETALAAAAPPGRTVEESTAQRTVTAQAQRQRGRSRGQPRP
ncbi:MAG: hypothetical protein HY699_01325 [Deltaproteobacteria bacterium]|nr:hypothetical protein [Deltaproteobacteria bacterium]